MLRRVPHARHVMRYMLCHTIAITLFAAPYAAIPAMPLLLFCHAVYADATIHILMNVDRYQKKKRLMRRREGDAARHFPRHAGDDATPAWALLLFAAADDAAYADAPPLLIHTIERHFAAFRRSLCRHALYVMFAPRHLRHTIAFAIFSPRFYAICHGAKMPHY